MELSLIDYKVRRSKRAKRLSLNMSYERGLEVVLPERWSEKRIAPFLKQHLSWIAKQSRYLPTHEQRAQLEALPQQIALMALEQQWVIHRKITATRPRLAELGAQELILSGPVEAEVIYKKLLTLWVKRQARHVFKVQLDQMSQLTGLSYRSLTIASQLRRWGSCDRHGNIRLNFKLIFLPMKCLHYVMIHELAHTIHMDHSPSFWQLVARYMADHKAIRRYLNEQAAQIPLWLTP